MDEFCQIIRIVSLIFLMMTLGCGSQTPPIKAPSGTPTATSVDTSGSKAKPITNSVSEVKPDSKQKEIESTFREFLSGLEEPDTEKWKKRYDESFDKMLKFGKDALPVLITALKDKNQRTRESASVIISAIGPSTPEETGLFLPYLKDESEMVRVNIVACLSLIPEQNDIAITQLKELLKSKDPSIQSTAAGSAANLGDKAQPLVDDLINIVIDTNSQARNLAMEALEKITELNQEHIDKLTELSKNTTDSEEFKEKLKSIIDRK